ncbi:MAG: DRTGG domain-containing protein [Nitrospiraceae bacterium]|nr:DRTGG domain-containing protein [Nitrospiraceae bacterium]
MNIQELIGILKLDLKNNGCVEGVVSGCYVSDMLSDVLANGKEGNIWITRQTHPNVVAVAAIRGLAGIIVPGGKQIEADTLEKAESECIPVMSTPLQTFEMAGTLYNLLLKNEKK